MDPTKNEWPHDEPDGSDDDFDYQEENGVGGIADGPGVVLGGGGAVGVPSAGLHSLEEGPLEQPVYESQNAQLLNDIAKDESLPALARFILGGNMGIVAKVRLLAQSATFLSKNQVFSNIENNRDFMMIQDDMDYVRRLSILDFTTFDMTSDYMAAEAMMQASHNVRLRRSRKALMLRQANTQRTENVNEEIARSDQEDRKLRSRIPLLGGQL